MGIIADNISENRYVIIDMRSYGLGHDGYGLMFWDNVDGWTFEIESATFFDHSEISKLNLPQDGAWLPVERVAYILNHPERTTWIRAAHV